MEITKYICPGKSSKFKMALNRQDKGWDPDQWVWTTTKKVMGKMWIIKKENVVFVLWNHLLHGLSNFNFTPWGVCRREDIMWQFGKSIGHGLRWPQFQLPYPPHLDSKFFHLTSHVALSKLLNFSGCCFFYLLNEEENTCLSCLH